SLNHCPHMQLALCQHRKDAQAIGITHMLQGGRLATVFPHVILDFTGQLLGLRGTASAGLGGSLGRTLARTTRLASGNINSGHRNLVTLGLEAFASLVATHIESPYTLILVESV